MEGGTSLEQPLVASVLASLDRIGVAACLRDDHGTVMLHNTAWQQRLGPAAGALPAPDTELPWPGMGRLQLWQPPPPEALREQSALLEAALERMQQGVIMVSAKRIVEVCNRRAIELLDLPPALMAARPPFEEVLAYQWSVQEFSASPPELQDFVRQGGILDQPHSYDRLRPDGRVIEVRSVPIDGGGVLRTYTDITERKRQEALLRHVASHDALTALANRAVLMERLAQALQACADGQDGLAVMYLDLDGFKAINDSLGHAVGDRMLAAVAARLRDAAGEATLVARMGGDEFAVLLQGVRDAAPAVALAQRLVAAVSEPVALDAHCLQVGVSVGIALHDGQPGTPDQLLQRADRAMYQAKAAGRGSVRVDLPPAV